MTRGFVIAVVLIAGSTGRAQERPFRSVAELAVVDFLAMDDTGAPVSQLRRDELALFVDGKPREIQQLQFVDRTTRVMPAAPATARPSSTTVPAVAEAVTSDRGRPVIIAVDHESIVRSSERLILEAAASFVKQLAPTDELTIVTLPRGRVVADASMPRARALAELQRVVGVAPPGFVAGNCNKDPESRFRLSAITDFLRGVRNEGEPVTMVYVSGTLPAAGEEGCRQEFERLRLAAESVGARFFVFQPNVVALDVSQRRSPADMAIASHAGLEDLAGVTGGELFRISGRADAAFARVLREISGRFVLGFVPVSVERDGRSHTIRLDTSRRGTTIRVAPSLVIKP